MKRPRTKRAKPPHPGTRQRRRNDTDEDDDPMAFEIEGYVIGQPAQEQEDGD